jgi:3',5'-cyclic AMP phosphodiesterase CpdA
VTTIAHISDLHFGTDDPLVAASLREDLRERSPSLVAVSGDLTQRARRREFEAARAFLEGLGPPVLAVPGNHDIPLLDVWSRFVRPLAAYRRHISPDTDPFFQREGLAVLGVNTARSNTWKGGRLSEDQVAGIRKRFDAVPASDFKVLVTHHPFLPSPRDPTPAVVGRGLQGLLAAEASGVDLLLAGHLHHGFSADVRGHYLSLHRSMLVAQAGTALSRRRRGEPNA